MHDPMLPNKASTLLVEEIVTSLHNDAKCVRNFSWSSFYLNVSLHVRFSSWD